VSWNSFLTTTASSSAGSSCVPGTDGVPHGVVGNLVCGSWATRAPHTITQLVHDRRPLLLAVVATVCAVRAVYGLARRALWRRHAAKARWLEIVPPVTATPAATLALWRLLATVLPASSGWSWRPHRIVWEVAADPGGMRFGLWLPPGVNPTAVGRLLGRAWPGVRAEQTRAPHLAPGSPAAALALGTSQPQWLPLVEDPTPARSHRIGEQPRPDEDRLRAVFDGLAAAGRTGGGLLQIHITRAPARRVAALRRATTQPSRKRRPTGGAARVISLAADGLRALVLAVLDLVASRSGRRPGSGSGPADPYLAELTRQARLKMAAAPHLLIAVRAAATGPTRAAARAAAADITSGYSLLSPHFTRRRLRRAHTAIRWRWVPANRMHLASVEETTAVAGLPAEPSAYGLPSAASRRRPVSREIFTAGPAPARAAAPASAPVVQPPPASPPTGAAGTTGTTGAPTVWTVP
jgi:hypothetical protein